MSSVRAKPHASHKPFSSFAMKLDIEDNDQRQRRIQNVLEKLNNPQSNQLISRVQAFLPQIEASNAIIAQADPRTVDIENVQGGQYIEMNLGLGVFKDKSTGKSGSDDDEDMSSASESDDGASSDSTDIVTSTFKMLRPTKPLPKRKDPRPRIEVLASSS